MAASAPRSFREAMDRIRSLRDGGLLLHAARDEFLKELGFDSWQGFVAAHPQCAGPGRSGPNDRDSPTRASARV